MRFEYLKTRIKDMTAHVSQSSAGKITVNQMDIDGQPFELTQRFWTSLQANYGFSNNFFKYFTHAEVFDRISDVTPNDKLNVCVEIADTEEGPRRRLLAASNPKKVTAKHDDLMTLLASHGLDVDNIDYGDGNRSRPVGFGHSTIGTGGNMLTSTGANSDQSRLVGDGIRHNDGTIAGATPEEQLAKMPTISYHEGVIRSIHTVRHGGEFEIGGDNFNNRFVLDIPIDGYGKPASYLVLLRIICSNMAIGYSPIFRSEIALGKGEDKFDYALGRAIEGYNNEEGFSALRNRFESAQRSWCSINEVNKAYKALVRLHAKGGVTGVAKRFMTDEVNQFEGTLMAEGSPIIQAFHKMVGELHKAYGLANLDALGVKRQATLPAGAKMYDMLNFMSEVATHHATPTGQRVLQAHIGDLVSAEYDLEGTVDKYGDWKDFLVRDKRASENLQVARQK